MTAARVTLLGPTADRAATMRNAVAHCLAEVRAQLAPAAEPPVAGGVTESVIAGIGTTAARALGGQLLGDAFARHGVSVTEALPFADPAALLADPRWDLALVLSPWKKDVGTRLASLAESAARTGVVDTILRERDRDPECDRDIGINTNSWAAQAAMETVTAGQRPDTVLVLGSGGSANSVALGCRRAWPATKLVGSARTEAAATEWAAGFDAEVVAPDEVARRFAGGAPALIVNTTTWGETEASESAPFAFPFAELTAPGHSYFDLNNRVSTLQTRALEAGMAVMSGTYMQRACNACRAALVTRRASWPHSTS